MEKISIKKLINFRNRSDRSKITFATNLNKEKIESNNSSGGDYWISCLSAIRNSFKYNNENLLDEKIDLLIRKINVTKAQNTKNQFQRNIDIINAFKNFDISSLKPNVDIVFLKQPRTHSIINISGFPIQVKPCFIYTFSENYSEEIGGIWFIATLNGFRKSELGMFADLIYRHLIKHYSKKFFVNPDYCIAIDLFNGQQVNFSEIKDTKITTLIDKTIDEIKGLLGTNLF